VERIGEILAVRDRRLAGPTAPAHGLCLRWIRYGPIFREAGDAA
jgi:tRNA pseudouridine38-40 synthase